MKTILDIREEGYTALYELLARMFDMVGADENMVDVKEPLWFHKYAWTEEQQDEFTLWMQERLKDRKFFRNYTRTSSGNNKKTRKSLAHGFVFNYGWMLK